MSFSPHIAERRFGYGMSPRVAPPNSVQDMLAGIHGSDPVLANYPLPAFREIQDLAVRRRRYASYARKFADTPKGKEAYEEAQEIRRRMRNDLDSWCLLVMQRRAATSRAFAERLVAFWADHLTALGKSSLTRAGAPLYIEEAVRPHIAGSFGDLLTACITHPVMLNYLDQNSSVGPQSRLARRSRGRNPNRPSGLNENLARELLELHTLGVDGQYTQVDVRELAELLTGLGTTRDLSFVFRGAMVEPGAETVLGQSYGPDRGMDAIRAVLRDLALHPATAAHLARKLAVHFVSDTPPSDLVEAIRTAYLDTGGDLPACYAALLAHPAAWDETAHNIRPPEEYLSAVLRALAPEDAAMAALKPGVIRRLFLRPMRLMGQMWMRPAGPDGFEEADEAWITPQGVAARLEWAMNTPARLVETLPDPEAFSRTAIGPDVPGALSFAANAAEDRRVAIGLILSSPAFQRR